MKKHLFKRSISLLLATATVLSTGILVSADESEDIEETACDAEITDAADADEVSPVTDDVIISEDNTDEEEIIFETEDVEIVETETSEEVIAEEITVDEDTAIIEAADAKNGWEKSGNHWYYYKNGEKVSGWQKISGKWYYFDEGIFSTHYMYEEGRHTINGLTYFFNSNGAMRTGWIEYYTNWYYCSSSGDAAKGWKKIGKNWYYFHPTSSSIFADDAGRMATGRQGIDGYYYFFNLNGVMQSGRWISSGSNSWYYAVDNGRLVTNRWMEIDGYWYYFKTSSLIVVNTSWTINGKIYRFDANGHCINPY